MIPTFYRSIFLFVAYSLAYFRKALDERELEIESHLHLHELSLTHNHSRKDDNGNQYPDITDEPELHYHKITLVTQNS